MGGLVKWAFSCLPWHGLTDRLLNPALHYNSRATKSQSVISCSNSGLHSRTHAYPQFHLKLVLFISFFFSLRNRAKVPRAGAEPPLETVLGTSVGGENSSGKCFTVWMRVRGGVGVGGYQPWNEKVLTAKPVLLLYRLRRLAAPFIHLHAHLCLAAFYAQWYSSAPPWPSLHCGWAGRGLVLERWFTLSSLTHQKSQVCISKSSDNWYSLMAHWNSN